MNKLLCDNNTVKTHHVNQSDFLRKVGFLDKIFIKKQFFYGHLRCSPCFIRLEILINFVGKKRIDFY